MFTHRSGVVGFPFIYGRIGNEGSNDHINGSEFGDKGNINRMGSPKCWETEITQVLQERFRATDGPTVFFLKRNTEGHMTRSAGNLL